MTCIIGLLTDNRIYIGGDSAGVSGWDIRHRADEKVFIKDNMIFGFTSSFRMGQLIRYSLKIPKQKKTQTDFEYLCTDFISAVIECFSDNGYARANNNEVSGGTFIFGYKNNLYKVEADFQVGKLDGNFDACGCGESYAMGAMDILNRIDNMSPENQIRKALETVSKYSAGVSGPFIIKSI